MKISIIILLLVSFTSGFVNAGEKNIRCRITYISGDVVYLSAGKEAGVKDSSRAFLFANHDTIAVLQVIATSSKNSACTIVSAKRRPVIGDSIDVQTVLQPIPLTVSDTLKVKIDSSKISAALPISTAPKNQQPAAKPFMTIQGRIGVRYSTVLLSNSSSVLTQPGVVFSIRGKINDSPLRFMVSGNVRTLIYGSSSPFQSKSVNQSRVYRLSLDYDDNMNQCSIGRITTAFASSTSYTDGVLLSRKIGDVLVGISGGYEPSFSQRSLSTEYKKFSVFAGYQPAQYFPYSGGISYGKTYYHSTLDREVMSGSFTMVPVQDIFIYTQSEVDLRTKKNEELITKPKLTNLLASIDYHAAALVTFGVGVSSSRPTYSFSAVRLVPDSLLDTRLQSSPTVSVNFYFPAGISLSSRYTPRTSEQEFGREYLNYTSLGISNILNQGITVRGTYNINTTSYTRTNGYSFSAQKTFALAGDFNLRYQFYRYRFLSLGNTQTSKSFAADMITSLSRSLTFWGTIERTIGFDADATTVAVELSWSF